MVFTPLRGLVVTTESFQHKTFQQQGPRVPHYGFESRLGAMRRAMTDLLFRDPISHQDGTVVLYLLWFRKPCRVNFFFLITGCSASEIYGVLYVSIWHNKYFGHGTPNIISHTNSIFFTIIETLLHLLKIQIQDGVLIYYFVSCAFYWIKAVPRL